MYKSNPIFEDKIDTFIFKKIGFFNCFHGLNGKDILKVLIKSYPMKIENWDKDIDVSCLLQMCMGIEIIAM